jgi:hypothetical protein
MWMTYSITGSSQVKVKKNTMSISYTLYVKIAENDDEFIENYSITVNLSEDDI